MKFEVTSLLSLSPCVFSPKRSRLATVEEQFTTAFIFVIRHTAPLSGVRPSSCKEKREPGARTISLVCRRKSCAFRISIALMLFCPRFVHRRNQRPVISIPRSNVWSAHGNGGRRRESRDQRWKNAPAADGQHLILHPLNMKCLLHHYGSYDTLPHRISGRILQLETVTQSEAMRRRYRFLSHFPLTTTF
ncbi:uncharacterized protein LOC130729782 [Lotus japonicus]|uniref:uncharacterized protein LOC130729782 n=1 Tax=Lotus japonicus TaxID=34305 RepID=UPI0025868CFF|nr:uncharacterized protein LOC130729782 [Lotus japonicus]